MNIISNNSLLQIILYFSIYKYFASGKFQRFKESTSKYDGWMYFIPRVTTKMLENFVKYNSTKTSCFKNQSAGETYIFRVYMLTNKAHHIKWYSFTYPKYFSSSKYEYLLCHTLKHWNVYPLHARFYLLIQQIWWVLWISKAD